MLESISWLQFGGFIFISLVIYYGYVLYRFYGTEVLGLVARWKDGGRGGKVEQVQLVDERQEAERTGKAEKGGNGENGEQKSDGERKESAPMAAAQEVGHGPGLSKEGQGVMFEAAAAEQPKPELFKVMEKVVVLLRAVINDGAATGVRREELEERIQQVLVKYRHLLRTPYAKTINHFITRACMTQFSLALSAEDLGRLWGVGKADLKDEGKQ